MSSQPSIRIVLDCPEGVWRWGLTMRGNEVTCGRPELSAAAAAAAAHEHAMLIAEHEHYKRSA
jgi:hypothetical protein